MRRSIITTVFVIVQVIIFVMGAWQPASAQDGSRSHTVASGETLTSIADKYSTSVEAIVALNKLKDANSVYIGQVLKIPSRFGNSNNSASAAQVSSNDVPGTYTIKPGDTLISIASRFGVSVDMLVAANKIKDAAVVQIGMVLKIPAGGGGGSGNGNGFAAAVDPSVPPLPDGDHTLSAVGGPSLSVKISGGRLINLSLLTSSAGKQGLPLSCEAKIAQQIAQMYGLPFDEAGFIANLPHSLNPKRGFVGSVNGRFYYPRDVIGGTATGPGGYGVHVEGWSPVFTALSGFQVQYLSSNPATAGQQIDSALRSGYPVAVWAVLGFKENIAKNSVWLGSDANGNAIDCGGPAAGCNYLVSGEHAYLIIGRSENSYLIFDPGKGEISYFQRNTVLYGITTLFAYPTGSAPGAIIIPSAGRVPDLSRIPNWVN
jgi:LysM repeat protein